MEDFIRKLEMYYTPSLVIDFRISNFDNRIWNHISEHQVLSEEFIRKYQNKVNWIIISAYQKLSEDFIREFQRKVFWPFIFKYQNLSEDFIKEFQDKIKKGDLIG
jgi:hypothetical protein